MRAQLSAGKYGHESLRPIGSYDLYDQGQFGRLGVSSVRIDVGCSIEWRNDWVAAVPATHGYGRLVRVFVVLDVGEGHPLRLEGVAELGIEQLDCAVVAGPNFW